MPNTLVIYYSRVGENYVSGKLTQLSVGNTDRVAHIIQDTVGADLFQVDTVNPYSPDYMTCIQEAKEELQKQARPELKQMLESIEGYTNIVIAGPCWWGTYPMAIFTQLEHLDFTGKNVFALMTHEGSGLADSEKDLKKICKGASFGQSLAVHGSRIDASADTIRNWAKANLQ